MTLVLDQPASHVASFGDGGGGAGVRVGGWGLGVGGRAGPDYVTVLAIFRAARGKGVLLEEARGGGC